MGLWEVGSDFFALAPRLDILGLFGLALLIPAVTRGFGDSKAAKMALTGSLAITIAVMIYSVFNDPQEIRGELKSQHLQSINLFQVLLMKIGLLMVVLSPVYVILH